MRNVVVGRPLITGVATVLAMLAGCGLFEPREPEPPSQSSSNFVPPTEPRVVIDNLQNAIAEKNLENYMSCFSDPTRVPRGFRFVPDPGALSLYPRLQGVWTYDEERDYFQQLITKGLSPGFSGLLLTLNSSSVSSDSVVYNYNYTFTFETRPENNFPSTARGNLQFTIGVDNNNLWSIYYWADNDLGGANDITWSEFKGRFSP